jgi:hypothetical protein
MKKKCNRSVNEYLIAAIISLAFCLLVNSCATMFKVSDEQKQNLLSKGFPVAILEVRRGNINSTGGVDALISWENISDKEIKYIVFIVIPYNRVNDVAPSTIGGATAASLRVTGPVKPGALRHRETENASTFEIV